MDLLFGSCQGAGKVVGRSLDHVLAEPAGLMLLSPHSPRTPGRLQKEDPPQTPHPTPLSPLSRVCGRSGIGSCPATASYTLLEKSLCSPCGCDGCSPPNNDSEEGVQVMVPPMAPVSGLHDSMQSRSNFHLSHGQNSSRGRCSRIST